MADARRFTETGGLGGALAYSSQSVNFYTAVLGLRGKYTFLTDWGSVAPRFRVEYNHDFAASARSSCNMPTCSGRSTASPPRRRAATARRSAPAPT